MYDLSPEEKEALRILMEGPEVMFIQKQSGFKKSRKCNNAKRPKPRKKKRK